MIAILGILLVTFLVFWQFFVKGLYPIPTDFLLAWFEPWKTGFMSNSTITIAHKPIADDIFRQLYPFKTLAMDLLKQGIIPLWNPYNGAGMPLFATMHVGFLNPFNLLFFVLPNSLAWSIHVVIQPFLIGITTYLYARKLSLSKIASFFSSISFMLSGFVIIRSIFADYDFAVAALPLLLYLVESYIENPRTKKKLFIPLVVFFILSVTQLQIASYILIFVFFYFLYRYDSIKKNVKNIKSLFFFFFYILLGIGLSFVQLIPTLELYLHANVTTGSSKFIFDHFLVSPSHLLSILIPNYFGSESTYNYWGAGGYIESIASVGFIPCFFAVISGFNRKKKTIGNFYWFAIIITCLLTLDWFATNFLYTLQIPVLSTSIPSRIFFLTSFSICILAGFGFQKWIDAKKISKHFLFTSGLFFIVILFILLITFFLYKNNVSCFNSFVPQCRLIGLRNTILEIGVFSFAFTSIIVFLLAKNTQRFIPFILILLIITVGLYNSYKFLPFTQKETILPSTSLLDAIKEHAMDGRVFGVGEANIKTDFASFFQYYDPNYYDPLYIKRYGELVSFANTKDSKSFLLRSDVEITSDINLATDEQVRRARLFNLLGIKYLVYKKSQLPKSYKTKKPVWQDKYWIIFQNETSLQRTYFVNTYEVLKSESEILEQLFDQSFNPKTSVILEESISSIESPKQGKKSAQIESYSANLVTIKAVTPNNSILVLSDNYYPGWKAYIDDKPTKLLRANYTFRAVVVPQGTHTIRFEYKPESLTIGAFLSGTALYVYLFLLIPKIRGNKNHRQKS